MPNGLNLEAVPEVWGWCTLPQAAERMKVSRQYVHRLAVQGKFKSLSRIGTTFVVNVWEVGDMAGQDDQPGV